MRTVATTEIVSKPESGLHVLARSRRCLAGEKASVSAFEGVTPIDRNATTTQLVDLIASHSHPA